jgi:hypothetical protein
VFEPTNTGDQAGKYGNARSRGMMPYPAQKRISLLMHTYYGEAIG